MLFKTILNHALKSFKILIDLFHRFEFIILIGEFILTKLLRIIYRNTS